ncbi:MAG TPA: hypothetical protein VMU14_22235 [Acidimicrobiales bacterium]|nr:hypothetical protein [Acidimicrobiales bacterium]
MHGRKWTIVGVLAAAVLTVAACSSSSKSSSSAAAGTPATAKTVSGHGGVFCTDAATNNLVQELQSNATANPAGGTSAVQKNLDDLKRYESEAPSAIKGDVTTLVNFYNKFEQVLSNDKGDLTKLASDMQGLEGQQAALTTAEQHVKAYYTANCHA